MSSLPPEQSFSSGVLASEIFQTLSGVEFL